MGSGVRITKKEGIKWRAPSVASKTKTGKPIKPSYCQICRIKITKARYTRFKLCKRCYGD